MVLKEPLQIDAKLRRDDQRGLYALEFRALGTRCGIQFASSTAAGAAEFARTAVGWVAAFEAKYSRFRDDSLISEINRQAGRSWVSIDGEAESVFALADDFYFLTGGILDPTMLPLIRLWDVHRQPQSMPADGEIAEALRHVGWSKVERRPGQIRLPEAGMALDLGGYGKEYAVDKVAALAVGRGIEACLVDFGQDIRTLGSPPGLPAWHLGLEDPTRPDSVWRSLALNEAGLATSGDYRRFFEHAGKRYGHIIDPRQGRPVANGTLAVSVVASSCLESGILSTAAFVLGEDEGLRLIEGTFGAEGCFVTDHSTTQTANFHRYVAN